VSGPAAVGAAVELPESAGEREDLALFGEGPSRVVVSVPAPAAWAFEALVGEFAVPWRWIGRVQGERLVIRRGERMALDVAAERLDHEWRSGLARHLG
jgi:phosphoribosylformylglycinamidine (FGAM) synthase-like enzyme